MMRIEDIVIHIDYVLGVLIVRDDLLSYSGSCPNEVMWTRMLKYHEDDLDQACYEGADLFKKLYNKDVFGTNR